MDSYFPKTRRPIAPVSLKRPKPSTTPPRTPPQPTRTKLQPPSAPKKLHIPAARRRCVRSPERTTATAATTITTTSTAASATSPKTTTAKATSAKPRVAVQLFPQTSPKKHIELAKRLAELAESPKKQVSVVRHRQPKEAAKPDLQQSPTKIAKGPLKGVSTSLLDIIRAKEAAAKAISPEEERERELLGIAPEVVRIVPTVFTSSKREILPYNKVVEKCHKGLNSNYTSATIIECLDLMEKVAPEWITTVTISKGKYMRINRQTYTIPNLLETIKRYKKKLTHNDH